MRRKLTLLLSLAAACLCLTSGTIAVPQEDQKPENEPFKRLTIDEVQKRLTDSSVHIYDGNTDELYREGHIPGAVHLFSKDIKEGVLPPDKNAPLIFYCHNER